MSKLTNNKTEPEADEPEMQEMDASTALDEYIQQKQHVHVLIAVDNIDGFVPAALEEVAESVRSSRLLRIVLPVRASAFRSVRPADSYSAFLKSVAAETDAAEAAIYREGHGELHRVAIETSSMSRGTGVLGPYERQIVAHLAATPRRAMCLQVGESGWALAVPLSYAGEVAATLVLTRRSKPFGESDIEDAKIFATPILPILGGRDDGLVLYLSSRATPIDRFMIDSVVFAVLGFGTDCEIVEFQQRENAAIVRLCASNPMDLLQVADALHERIWEAQERADSEVLRRLDKAFQLDAMGFALGMLADKIERMELRLLAEDAVERLEDLGGEHVREKDRRLLKTPGQTVVSATWESGKRLAGKSLARLLASVVDMSSDDAGA